MNHKNKSIALLIATYNWPEALELVFQSVLTQSHIPDEIIVADDGSGEKTKRLIDKYQSIFGVPLVHCWQNDEGFRKSRIVNIAFMQIESDYVIQIDGDMVLHRDFIHDHMQAAERGNFVMGSRVLLSDLKTKRLIKKRQIENISFMSHDIRNRFNALRIPFLSAFFSQQKRRSDNFRGCNIAYWRLDFQRVNGYNNDIFGWGHEDIELAARFVNHGLCQKKIKMMAIAYHLYHIQQDREFSGRNYKIYFGSVKNRIIRCPNGLVQLVNEKNEHQQNAHQN